MDGYELVLQFRGRRVETEDEVGEIEDALFELLEDGERWDGHEVLAGLAAAFALEFELHDEAERVLPLGLLFGPYVAWGVAWLVLRTRSAPPAPAAQGPDSRT